jgi:hypothetical protein
MANEVTVTITGKDNVSGSFDSAKKSAGEYGGTLDSGSEKADKLEQRTLGLKDTVDGLGAVLQGPNGKQGLGGYIQGWADLAGGFANFVFPALKGAWKSVISLGTANGRAALMTTIHTVASKVAAVATKGLALAQRALNAAMRANPIGIIITILALLVAGIIYAYKHSAKFRAIVQAAWSGIKVAAQASWNFIKAVFKAYVAMILVVAGKIREWASGVVSAWGRIKSAFSSAISAIKGWISSGVAAWRNSFSNALSFIRSIPGKIKGFFSNARSWLSNAGRNIIQGLINGIRSAPGNIMAVVRSLIPDSIEKFIPGFAQGGIIGGAAAGGPRGGLVMVGERGPELVRLPGGSHVYPNGQGGGGEQVIELHIGDQYLGRFVASMIDNNERSKRRKISAGDNGGW